MADTAFSTSHASTVTLWSAVLFLQAQKQTFFEKFVGEDMNSMVQVKSDLMKESGDTIKFDLLMNLTGSGVTGDTEIEGNEEQLVLHQDSVTIDCRGNGVKAAGKMSLRRTKHSIKKMAKTALGNWLAQIRDDDFLLALSGQANLAGQASAVIPDSDHKWSGGGKADGTGMEKVATDSALDADNLFITQVIDWVSRKAILIDVKVRPIITEDGSSHYVNLIHPYQMKAIRSETAWKEAQQYANVRGNKNPLFSGAAGMWNNVVVHQWEKIITRLGAGGSTPSEYFDLADDMASGIYGARSLFCGAQAAVIGYGQYPGWYEKNFDYGRVPGVATDIIYGIKKTRFNSKDFGVISVDTAYVGD